MTKETQPKIELVKTGAPQQIKYRNLSDIHLLEKNPRTIKKDQFEKLCTSIRDNPDYFAARPIILSNRTKKLVIIAGNQRYKAAKELKLKKVPTYLLQGLTEAKEREIIIRDNISNGEWDWDELANSWNILKLQDWGIDLPGFLDKDEAVGDDYQIPETFKTYIVKGDLFEIGDHRLLCGDSRNADELATLMNSQLIDLYVTDPPYGVSYTGGTKDALEIENDSLSEEETHKLWIDCLNTTFALMRSGAAIYATVAPGPLHIGFAKALHDLQALRQIMVWNKGQMVLGHSDYHYQHEPILYGWKPGAKHYFTKDRTQTTVFDVKKPLRNADHPTMKPVELWSIFINNSSKKEQIVYDSFGGSGTTMVACHQLKRKAYLIECDPKYCAVIIDRMQKLDTSIEIKKNGKPYQPKAI